MKSFDFIESLQETEEKEAVDDIIGKSLFKYKYRKIGDEKYLDRSDRVVSRFLERAKSRDPKALQDLGDKLEKLYVSGQIGGNVFDFMNTVKKGGDGYDEFMPFAKYVAEEGFQQFKDYYESDDEEGMKFKGQIWEDLPDREKLRFSECYDNPFHKGLALDKYYVTIPKRPYDNNKSIFSNFVEDLVDFNNRVRPISRNLAFRDATSKFQSLPFNEKENNIAEEDTQRYRKILDFKKSGANYLDQISNDEKRS